ncbi:MAG: GTP cyclohydrolase I FolE [bacterium]|nr:GTP cyclohydrolase I FolE [bacterium]
MDSIVLSLGSNIGQRENHLAQARLRLEGRGIRILKSSRIYETEPVDFEDQPKFLNQALSIETGLNPGSLMKACLEIEKEMGRKRQVKNGPRNIDIDLLFYGNRIIDSPELQLPHRRLHERRFVLEPLAEIIPNLKHPQFKHSIRDLLDQCPDRHQVKALKSDVSPISESVFQDWIRFLGDDPSREGLQDSHRRFTESRKELFRGYDSDPNAVVTLFDSEGYDEMIISRDIDFYSTCEHHLLPFYGKAHIGYIPDKHIIGLSKFSRIIDVYARRLQNQERLTTQIAGFLWEKLNPKGLGVILEAQHLCIQSRGADKQNSSVSTSSFKGLFKKRPETRAEFLNLIAKSSA